METKNKTEPQKKLDFSKKNELLNKSDILKKLFKNKYVILILLIGLALVLIPTSRGAETPSTASPGLSAPEFSLEREEDRLRELLADIDGVGQVSVLLSLKSTSRRILAESGDEPLVVNQGSGTQSAVDITYVYPEYLGASIVCSGADRASVRLAVTEAVKSFTGLSTDKITVIKLRSR